MPKRLLRGVVVNDRSDKTVAVKIERRFSHPLFKKTVRRTKKFQVHDEHNVCKVGDVIFIEESRPISKQKKWVVVQPVSQVSESVVSLERGA